jgi:hypothetical protein
MPNEYTPCLIRNHGGEMKPMSIHDLFNELNRRLLEEADEHDVALMALATGVDGIHHDYTELTQ